MAKQIKVIKCPQCGNTKPTEIPTDKYQCDKCDTVFFLDNDDININVNHQYHTTQTYSSPNSRNAGKHIGYYAIFFSIVAMALIIMFNISDKKTASPGFKVFNRKYFEMPLSMNGTGAIFSIENKNALLGNEGQGVYAIARDIETNDVIKEQKLSAINKVSKVDHRWFRSDSTGYLAINGLYIYRINKADSLLVTDITPKIAAGKPALNSGFSSVAFVHESNGEGFRLNTNLGKEFFYFPKADMLYTENAFKYVAQGQEKTLLPDARNEVYYLFINKENVQSSNVAQLMRITYKFNNGGPENKLLKLTAREMKQLSRYRIVSCDPVLEERICFSPAVLYSDTNYILITYRTTLANDAPVELELLDRKGKTVWVKSLDDKPEIKTAVRTHKGFILQTRNKFLQINL